MHRVLVLVGSVILASLFAVGFAQSEKSRVPPKDGCTFEFGRTVCEEVNLGEIETVTELPLGPCDGPDLDISKDGTLYSVGEFLVRVNTVQLTTYYGNSHVVESASPVEEDIELVEVISESFLFCDE